MADVADEIPDDYIDHDLAVCGFDMTEKWPEYGHGDLREAWRAGFEDAAVRHAPRYPAHPDTREDQP